MNPIAASGRLRVGEWLVDPTLDEISRGGRTIKLEPRKMQLLIALARRPGQLLTTEELLENVWPGVVVTSSSLYQSIAQLRKSLGDESDEPTYIATIPRKGYRLVAQVTPVPADEATTSPGAAPGAAVAQPASTWFAPRFRLRWAAVAAVIGLGIALWAVPAEWFARWIPWNAEPLAVAVLPFADLGDSRTEQALCDGLAEELLNGLTRVPGLRVAARGSSFSFRDRSTDVREIGRKLDVTHVLEGNVRRTGDELRVTAKLIDARTGRDVWSDSYERQISDAPEIQAEIAAKVASVLHMALTPETTRLVERRLTTNVEAYDLYLLGRHHWYQRTPESLVKARNYFQLALDRDPKFALAYVGLADTYVGSYYYAGMPVREAAAHAQPLIDKALALDSVLPEAYATQGLLRAELEKPAEAEIDLRRAIALNANYANAYLWLGITFDSEARPVDALGAFESAAKLDPLNFVVQARMGVDLVNAGRYDEATATMQRAMTLSPNHPNPVWGMADLERMRGRLDASVEWFRKALTLEPRRGDLWNLLGLVFLDLGDAAQATAAFDSALALDANDTDALLGKAWILVARGESAQLGQYLDQHRLETRTSPGIALDVAYLEFLADRPVAARQQYKDALLLAESTGYPLFSAWEIRLGHMQALDVASFDAVVGAPDSILARLNEVAGVLDRFESNGVIWHGLHYQRARIEALRGERSKALASLNKAHQLGWRRSWWTQRDPALKSLRDDPAFRAIIARMDADLAGARGRLATHDSG